MKTMTGRRLNRLRLTRHDADRVAEGADAAMWAAIPLQGMQWQSHPFAKWMAAVALMWVAIGVGRLVRSAWFARWIADAEAG